jgi:hypothetical protein
MLLSEVAIFCLRMREIRFRFDDADRSLVMRGGLVYFEGRVMLKINICRPGGGIYSFKMQEGGSGTV